MSILSRSLDSPESPLDALLQAALCTDVRCIAWQLIVHLLALSAKHHAQSTDYTIINLIKGRGMQIPV